VEGIRGEKQKKNEKQKTDSYENIISRDAQLSEVLLDLLKHGLAMTVFQTQKKSHQATGRHRSEERGHERLGGGQAAL
jgi:hypothetical protein